ncbi:MAG: hypothetical protein HQL31_10825, partial [Planctomycetes bacterium]|nr:hypothetical protein [Planctomycetota bacterium]
MSSHRTDRFSYEREHGSYDQPRYAFRKLLGRVLPLLPGFRLRRRLYRLLGVDIHPEVSFIGLGFCLCCRASGSGGASTAC